MTAEDKRAQRALRLLALLAALAAASCGGGGEAQPSLPDEPGSAVFVFRLRGHPSTEEFRVATDSASFISQARAQLLLPPSQRLQFVIGAIEAGDGGHNIGWNWHFADASLTETAIELCDGTPRLLEADLDYWLNTVRSFCPWSSYVYAEVR